MAVPTKTMNGYRLGFAAVFGSATCPETLVSLVGETPQLTRQKAGGKRGLSNDTIFPKRSGLL